MTSAILVLGGTGTVGSRIVRQLSSLSDNTTTILVASRHGSTTTGITTTTSSSTTTATTNVHHVPFDWHDPSTWSNPFTLLSITTTANANAKIRAAYLVAPPSLGAEKLMTDFVDLARGRGVARFVLQSASPIEAGGPAMGKVHAYLRELGERGEVEWAVLRPTWFQQNFATQQGHIRSIKEESKIYSATGQGKIPWVSADDIAAVAVRALTDADPPNAEYLVLGPELLSYDDIAEILSDVLGRKIVHVDLSAADLEKRHQEFGMSEDYARMMSALDTAIKYGAENRTNDGILAVTGAAPKEFRAFAESVKEVWQIRS
ncbi:hypothetical protein VTK26DRAFT_1587 [Humicola hyalothermophila]